MLKQFFHLSDLLSLLFGLRHGRIALCAGSFISLKVLRLLCCLSGHISLRHYVTRRLRRVIRLHRTLNFFSRSSIDHCSSLDHAIGFGGRDGLAHISCLHLEHGPGVLIWPRDRRGTRSDRCGGRCERNCRWFRNRCIFFNSGLFLLSGLPLRNIKVIVALLLRNVIFFSKLLSAHFFYLSDHSVVSSLDNDHAVDECTNNYGAEDAPSHEKPERIGLLDIALLHLRPRVEVRIALLDAHVRDDLVGVAIEEAVRHAEVGQRETLRHHEQKRLIRPIYSVFNAKLHFKLRILLRPEGYCLSENSPYRGVFLKRENYLVELGRALREHDSVVAHGSVQKVPLRQLRYLLCDDTLARDEVRGTSTDLELIWTCPVL